MYWKVSVGLKCVRISRIACLLNLSPLKTVVSRKFISLSEISAVNLIVGWCLLARTMNSSISFLSTYCQSALRQSLSCQINVKFVILVGLGLNVVYIL